MLVLVPRALVSSRFKYSINIKLVNDFTNGVQIGGDSDNSPSQFECY